MNMLVDPHARQLSYLRLSITDLCNFKCSYCLPNGYSGKKQTDELSLQEIGTVVSTFAKRGIGKVRITGGEPTLRRDLNTIIHQCKQTSGIHTVALTTNGYKLHKAHEWINAGLDQINISIDSFNPEHFADITGANILPQILRAIDNLIDNGFEHIKINSVLMRQNTPNSLANALQFIKQRPVTLRFIELMQMGDHPQVFFKEHISANDITRTLIKQGWQQRIRKYDDGPALEYTHSAYRGSIGVIAPYRPNFCDSCNRLRVSSTGKLHLCLFDHTAFDLRPWLRRNDHLGLADELDRVLPFKPSMHQLHQQSTGLMKHLAQIGG